MARKYESGVTYEGRLTARWIGDHENVVDIKRGRRFGGVHFLPGHKIVFEMPPEKAERPHKVLDRNGDAHTETETFDNPDFLSIMRGVELGYLEIWPAKEGKPAVEEPEAESVPKRGRPKKA